MTLTTVDGLPVGPQGGVTAALPAPAAALIQAFQAALGRAPTATGGETTAIPAGPGAPTEALVETAHGLAPSSAGPASHPLAPSPFGRGLDHGDAAATAFSPEATGGGPGRFGDEWTWTAPEREPLAGGSGLDAGVLAGIAQAIAPLLLAVAPTGLGRTPLSGPTPGNAPAVAPAARDVATALGLVPERTGGSPGVAETPGAAPLAPSVEVDFDVPQGLPLAPAQATLLPRAVADGRFLGFLERAGVDADTATALLPALVAAVADRPRTPAPAGRDEGVPATLGAAMLQSLAQQSAGATTSVSAAPPPPSVARIEALQQTLAETVSRVLVSDPLHDGRREVRLTLAQDILPNTEVRLWRQENRIHIEFITPAGTVDRSFGEALPRLAEAIQQKQPQFDLPVVTVRGQGGFEQPGDGRSRQQYQTQEELEGQA